jgi:hypothetical protein
MTGKPSAKSRARTSGSLVGMMRHARASAAWSRPSLPPRLPFFHTLRAVLGRSISPKVIRTIRTWLQGLSLVLPSLSLLAAARAALVVGAALPRGTALLAAGGALGLGAVPGWVRTGRKQGVEALHG